MSLPGRIIVLIAFLTYIIVTVFGIMNLEIKFSTRFFVDERFYLFNYFDAQDDYFSNIGDDTEIITTEIKAGYAAKES